MLSVAAIVNTAGSGLPKNWKQVTIVGPEDVEYVSLINLDRVVVIVPDKNGTKLEIDNGYVYMCKEKLEDFR